MKADKIRMESSRLEDRIDKIVRLEGKLFTASWAVEEAEDSATEALGRAREGFPLPELTSVGEGSTYVSVIEEAINSLGTHKLRLIKLRRKLLKKEANDE